MSTVRGSAVTAVGRVRSAVASHPPWAWGGHEIGELPEFLHRVRQPGDRYPPSTLLFCVGSCTPDRRLAAGAGVRERPDRRLRERSRGHRWVIVSRQRRRTRTTWRLIATNRGGLTRRSTGTVTRGAGAWMTRGPRVRTTSTAPMPFVAVAPRRPVLPRSSAALVRAARRRGPAGRSPPSSVGSTSRRSPRVAPGSAGSAAYPGRGRARVPAPRWPVVRGGAPLAVGPSGRSRGRRSCCSTSRSSVCSSCWPPRPTRMRRCSSSTRRPSRGSPSSLGRGPRPAVISGSRPFRERARIPGGHPRRCGGVPRCVRQEDPPKPRVAGRTAEASLSSADDRAAGCVVDFRVHA